MVSQHLVAFSRICTDRLVNVDLVSPLCSPDSFKFRWCLAQIELSCFFPHEALFRLKHSGPRKYVCFYFDNIFARLPVLFRPFLIVLTPKQQLSLSNLQVLACCFSKLFFSWNPAGKLWYSQPRPSELGSVSRCSPDSSPNLARPKQSWQGRLCCVPVPCVDQTHVHL